MSEFDPDANLSIGGFTYVPERKYREALWALNEISNPAHKWRTEQIRFYAWQTYKRITGSDPR